MDWNHEGLPPLGSRASAWLDDGTVRKVAREGFYGDLRFTDCTHELQNAYCDPERVMAWRLDPQTNMPAQQVASSAGWGWIASLLGL